jgi:hypothetical protein
VHEILKKNKINFVDLEFPPLMSSIQAKDEVDKFTKPVVWKRPKEFMQVDSQKGLYSP